MARLVVGLAALCFLACGPEGTIQLVDNAGAGGDGSGEEPAGTAGTGPDGTSGSGGETPQVPESDVITVDDGDFKVGEPPPPEAQDALPQIVALTGPAAVTNGGSAVLHVELSPAPTSPTFVVRLDGDTGYHTVTGVDPEGDGTYDISVQVSAEADQASLVLGVALMGEEGTVGPYREIEIALVQSGTGDVKVTLSFDRLHDLDLHVVEPDGERIEYMNPLSETGGALDLDSGVNCMPSTSNSENIFWPPGGAPAGEYVVSVQNYQQCSPGAIDYTVRVEYDGNVSTYHGSFADGTAGETPTADNLKEVVRFRRGE